MNSRGGKVTFDSGILAIPYTLGWFGGILYFTAIFFVVRRILRLTVHETDTFAMTCAAIVVSFTAQLMFANTFTGLKGILFWTFASLALSSARYYREIKAAESSVDERTHSALVPQPHRIRSEQGWARSQRKPTRSH